MAHGILNLDAVTSMNIDAYNRSAVSADDLDNGNIFALDAQDTGTELSEVWDVIKPATGAHLTNLWMAAEPEAVVTYSGTSAYKGLDPDPRNFYIKASQVFRAISLKVGDVVELSADALATGTGAASAYAVATNGTYQLTWASAPVSGLSLTYLATTYISLADGSIGTQRVSMYKFAVTAIA
jgi:hypothetical protein